VKRVAVGIWGCKACKKTQQHGGLDAFKRQWFNLVEKGYASSLVYYFELLL
jgi:ribosomal protein L37AE/L43A